MTKYITAICSLLLLLAMGTAAMAQDAQNITVIPNGQTLEGSLRGEIAAQMFAFNAVEGDIVTVNLGLPASTTFNPVLLILGPAGQVAASTDSSATINIPFSGSYFIIVTTTDSVDGTQVGQLPESFDSPQPFTVSVSGNNPPADIGNRLAYFRTPLESGTSFEGYSSPSEPIYYFVFEGQENQSVDIIMTSGEIDSLLLVFDSVGNLVATNDDAEGIDLPSNRDAAIENLQLPSSGLYFVFATDIVYHTIPQLLAADAEGEDVDLYRGGDFVIILQR